MSSAQYVTWDEIDSLVSVVAEKIKQSSRSFSKITTLSRGGLIPSRLLADHLGIDIVSVDEDFVSHDSLFVDDIFDSGKTFVNIVNKTDNAEKLFFVTLFARIGKNYPSQLIYGKQTNSDDYVVFPWDKLEYENSKI